ncbi:NADP-dependent oxidoreductase [soil metagenome]
MAAGGLPTEIPDYGRPGRSRRVVLCERPTGIPQPAHFRLDEVPEPEPAEGELLVRNIFLSVDPAQRGWVLEEANYSEPARLGSPMRALAVGVVVRSRADGWPDGEFVYGWFGWQDYAAVHPSKVIMKARLPLTLPAFAGLLGIKGVTAYLALTRLGGPAEGDTVLVSTAAGAVGSIAGQIANILGCETIGLTGSDGKVEACLSRFGYRSAFNYKTADLAAVLAQAAPDGIDVFFDNTGGPILDAGLRRMAIGGRVVQCGTASVASWSPSPQGPRNEREILTRQLVWSGFVIFSHADRFEEAAGSLAKWYLDGRLVSEVDIAEGIDQAPGAIAELYTGGNSGKKLIYVG